MLANNNTILSGCPKNFKGIKVNSYLFIFILLSIRITLFIITKKKITKFKHFKSVANCVSDKLFYSFFLVIRTSCCSENHLKSPSFCK